MTASMQNFREETESAEEVVLRIGDTWSYMGDAVATEGADIADAMSKASASVRSVGLEFEQASAYAAVMLARTQQTGQVIGTQLNSLASRYAKITSTGFRKVTEDDEGEALSFNDVAKALQQANIEIYDSAKKTFLPMGEMLDQLSKKWDGLDSAQQKYIATAVGGTRGMNYFLTLMENYDLAISLQEEAMNNRGVVNEKYLIWMQGLEAAQNDLANSSERLYSILSADFLTDAYHGIASIVDGLTNATEATDAWNIKLPILAYGLAGVLGAIVKIKDLISAFEGVNTLTGGIGTFLSKGGVGLAVGGIALIATAIGAIASASETAEEKLARLNAEIQEKSEKYTSLNTIADGLDALMKKTELTNEEVEEFNALRSELAKISPSVRAAYGSEAEKLTEVADAAKVVNEELERQERYLKSLAFLALDASIDVYNDSVKEIYKGDNTGFTPFDKYEGYSGTLKEYIGFTSSYGLETGLEVLQAYRDEFARLLKSDWIDEDPLYREWVENEFERFEALCIAKTADIEKVNENLRVVLENTASNLSYFDLFNENPEFKESIIDMFLGEDWGDTDGEKISEWMDSFIKLFPEYLAKGGDIDYLFKEHEDFFGEKHSLASIILESLMSEGVDEAEIQKAVASVADILNGITMDALQHFEIDIFKPQGSILNSVVQEMQTAMDVAISNRDMMGSVELGEALEAEIKNGEKSLAAIKRYNEVSADILAKHFNNKISDDEQISMIQELTNKFLTLSEEEFVEWTITAHPDIFVPKDEMEDSVDKALSDVQKYLDEQAKKNEATRAEASLYKGYLGKASIAYDIQGLEGFKKYIDDLYESNSDLTESFLEMYPSLGAIYNGLIEGAEATKVLEEYQKDSRYAIQATTQAMIDEAKAAEQLEKYNLDNGTTVLKSLQDAYNSGGYESFISEWSALSKNVQEAMVSNYMGIAELAGEDGQDIVDWAERFAEAIEISTNAMGDYDALKLELVEAAEQYIKELEKEEAAQDNYIDQLKEIEAVGRDVLIGTGDEAAAVQAMTDAMIKMGVENDALMNGMLGLHGELYKLTQEGLTWAEALKIITDAQITANAATAQAKLEAKGLGGKMRTTEIVEDAKGYVHDLDKISAKGFIDELKTLNSVLHDPTRGVEGFIQALAEFEPAVYDAMLAENEWIQGVVDRDISIKEAIKLLGQLIEQHERYNEVLAIGNLENVVGRFGMTGNEIMEARDQIETVQNMLEEIRTSGEDFDMEGFFKAFPEAMSAVRNESEAIVYLEEKLTSLNETYKEVLEALGMMPDAEEDYSKAVVDAIRPMDSAEKAMNKLRKGTKLTADEIGDLADEYPDLRKELLKYNDGVIDAEELTKALNEAFEEKAIEEWAQNVADAMAAVDDAAAGTAEYEKAVEALGYLFTEGMGEMDSFDFALQNLDLIRAAIEGDIVAFQRLQEAAFINITGMSTADFSAVQNGLALVEDDAIAVGNLLASIGMGTVETRELPASFKQLTFENGKFKLKTLNTTGKFSVWVPSKSNPFSKKSYSGSPKSTSSGGGGGGSESIKVSEEVEDLTSGMEQTNDNFENRKKIAELKKEYHEIRGEIQGVIGYTKIEADIIEEQNNVLKENIAALEKEMKAKEAILSSNNKSSKAYKQASADLDELNSAHKEYSETLLENENRLEEVKKELEDLQEEARQATISVQDLLRETLEAQDERDRDMHDATVELEDEILGILTARYEKEQELAIETAQKKIEALQDEMDAIDELIEARRKLLEEEEKENEIAELEAKIARISADPTRRKELLQLQAELAEKRKDMSWESYEEEMNAQKDSIGKQITSLEEYVEYVNEYYEKLFENPKQLIEEMEDIMSKTDEEIIDWLKENYEEFDSYSKNKQDQMVRDWKDMTNRMRGITETYKKEIEALMKLTDEEILKWLAANNIEFKNATTEQQQSFLHSWKQTLEAWRNAYKEVQAEVTNYDYKKGDPDDDDTSGSKDSTGGGTSTTTKQSYKGTAVYQYRLADGSWTPHTETAFSTKSKEDAISKAKDAGLTKAKAKSKKAGYTGNGTNVFLVQAYKEGGLNTQTGLAWLDGTKQKPERILSAYQTELFEDLLKTLHMIKTLSVSGITNVKAPEVSNGMTGFNIEQIQVIVENLDTEDDYDELAEKVGEKLKEQMLRSMAVGSFATLR